MGSLLSKDLPNFNFSIKSDCCNGKDCEDGEYDGKMVRFRRSSWLHRRRKIKKNHDEIKEGDGDMVEKLASLQLEQTDETEISNEKV